MLLNLKKCRDLEVIPSSSSCSKVNNQIKDKIDFFSSSSNKYKVINSKRLYFYSAPSFDCKVSSDLFIIQNDIVSAYAKYKDFYLIKYINKKGEAVKGWVYYNRLKALETNNDATKEQYDNSDQVFLGKLSNYCKPLTSVDDQYESKASCFFKNESIESVYLKAKLEIHGGEYLKDHLTVMIDSEYHINKNGLTIIYKWLSKDKLKLTLMFDSGVTTLYFEETPIGVKLMYSEEFGG